jgi:hypothetical protein
MAVSPIKTQAAVGSKNQVSVWNQGTTPIHVTMSAREILRNANGRCVAAPHNASWATVTPASFTIKPGGHEVTTLTIRPGAKPGQHDLAAWATTPTGVVHTGGEGIQTDASVGSQFLVKVPGTVAATTAKPCVSLAPPHAHGFPVALTLGLVVVWFVVVGAIVAFLLRGKSRRRKQAAA